MKIEVQDRLTPSAGNQGLCSPPEVGTLGGQSLLFSMVPLLLGPLQPGTHTAAVSGNTASTCAWLLRVSKADVLCAMCMAREDAVSSGRARPWKEPALLLSGLGRVSIHTRRGVVLSCCHQALLSIRPSVTKLAFPGTGYLKPQIRRWTFTTLSSNLVVLVSKLFFFLM